MTIARKVFATAAVAGMSVLLAGCVGGGGGGTGPVRPVQTGVEGTWIDAQGTGLSTISGGVFTTVATDTGQKLAEGSYMLNDPTRVQISGTSLIRQAPIGFNCLLVSSSQLNCTSSGGQQFVLTRRA